MAVRICVFLSQRGLGDSPPNDDAEVVYETLIMPAMESFTDFRMNPRGFVHETSSINDQLVHEIINADLVIADISELSPSGYFELGVRQASGLPVVYIGELDYSVPYNLRELPIFHYRLDTLPRNAGGPELAEELAKVIQAALAEPVRQPGSPTLPKKATPKERREELAEGIIEAAEVIRLLRINSAGDAITDLIAIADELKTIDDPQTPSALKEAAEKALNVLFRIMDQLATVRGSRIAISGTVAMLVGGAGWPAVTALGLGLAFWEGKDAFLKAMDKMSKKKP